MNDVIQFRTFLQAPYDCKTEIILDATLYQNFIFSDTIEIVSIFYCSYW